ncbi:hypothetical protein AQUCO_04000085v1 [Aquilegia coerulea]|uniref:Bifunctional inhibitor/plant lipid transfer protein/seed storage helical domain-containing protein n=1 Tax=Aquilegia coerulea TaxID=218851 RepID=A0A2G5CR80_AQUCA|nr:hypothetical protein AQUCO_04000085v1 [Aquilegia coerulea]
MMSSQSSLVIFTFLLFCFLNGSVFCAAPPTVEAQCSSEFSKVGVCLSFATGKADSPSKECCSTVQDIKDRNPVCLCFVIQQAHDGSSSLKSMGLQEAKLLQLPSACKLTNASISECPKLLNLSPSSPDNAIFKDPSPSTMAPAATSTPSTKKDSSMGFMHKPFLAFPVAIALATTMFISVFSVEISSPPSL